MDIKTVKKELAALRKEIRHHNKLYYDDDAPVITDYEYDQLMLRLKKWEKAYPELITNNSPTQVVGGEAKRTAGVLVRHDVPMLSLQDVFSEGEIREFVTSLEAELQEPEFVVEEKIDGLSVALRYVDGRLDKAITRGDGVVQGEDVTANARAISDVVPELSVQLPYFEIRGEVYMSRQDFAAVNERQRALGLKIFANPRNCAAGTLRQLDSRVTKERKLSLFIFNLQAVRGMEFDTHTSAYGFMEKEGIKVIHAYEVCHNADEVWAAVQRIGASRGNLPYDIDGAVVKLNSFADRRQLGHTSKVPRWAIAYKYPPEEKKTRLRNIELSVGRTGRITPVAVFAPVSLCGTMVERATLHNQDFIDKLDVRIGDLISVYKSGEIIPKVKGVDKKARPAGAEPFQIGDKCPVCGAKALRTADTADIRCTNAACPAQLENHILNFVSRDAMDIKGFGAAGVKQLIDKGFLHDAADIYTLSEHREEIIALGLVGKEKSTDKLLASIDKSRHNEPFRLLTGLGIDGVGKSAAKALLRKFSSLQALCQAQTQDIEQVHDIGSITAEAVADWFANEDNAKLIARLAASQVNMSAAGSPSVDEVFADKVFVITGALPDMSRQEMAAFIEQHGGRVSGSISRKTSYLVAGEAAGSKLAKAIALDVLVLSAAEVQQMAAKKENNG